MFGDFGVAAGAYRGRWFDETFKKGAEEDARAERIWEQARAEAIEQKCQGKTGTVTEEKKPQTQIPPLLYDLTTLQREANSRFGLPAGRTLQIAQALYERHKVLTYPRTDSRYLPEDYISNDPQCPGRLRRSLPLPPRREGARERLGPPEQAHLQQRESLRSLRHRPHRRGAEGTR